MHELTHLKGLLEAGLQKTSREKKQTKNDSPELEFGQRVNEER